MWVVPLLIIGLIILVLILCLFLAGSTNSSQLSYLEQAGRAIVDGAGYSRHLPASYKLRGVTYGTSKTIFDEASSDTPLTIQIRLTRPEEPGTTNFPAGTLILVYLHELAHLICRPIPGHGAEFTKIERRLIEKAIELGYITAQTRVDKSYPLHDVILR